MKYSIVLLLTTIAFVGCGSGISDLPPLGKVEGLATLDGKPLSNIRIVFQPEEGGRASDAIIDEQGHYKLIYSSTEYGAKVGTHRVYFENQLDLSGKSDLKVSSIPPQFGAKSKLNEKVSKGKNKIDFELKSAK